MTPKALTLAASLGLILTACQQAEEQPQDTPTEIAAPEMLGSAMLLLANGEPAGTAELVGTGNEAALRVELTGLPPGAHGFHLHMTGACNSPDFSSAGAHLNPGGKEHGTDNPQGAHLGDLPNVGIGPDGTGQIDAPLRGTRADVLDKIFDDDGTAVMVHEAADDYATDPAGAAGDRIACGVLSRS